MAQWFQHLGQPLAFSPRSDGVGNADDASIGSTSLSELPMHHPSRQPVTASTPPFKDDIAILSCWKFQIDLGDVLGRYCTDLNLYREIVDLLKNIPTGKT